ncbi:MAG: T9SS type A sorting domain-containing protein [Bacteroidetes bacterium]|nr:T9SS type A sorting domain-containing protein [Bacteroidota bacterium]
MKNKIFCNLFLIFFFSLDLFSQTQWTSKWKEVYATYDDESNGTGDKTASVAVFKENKFIAVVTSRNSLSFLIPYVNADSGLGRKMSYGYNPTTVGVYLKWFVGFDEVYLKNTWQVAIGPDSLIYVANNDDAHNILVFALKDTIEPVDFRTETGTNGIHSLHVDKNGYVYVLNDTSIGKTDDLKIFPPKNQWSSDRKTQPIKTLDLPDGIYKGVVTSKDGKVLFISDYTNRKVYRYDGSPTSGYTKINTFKFDVLKDTVQLATTMDTATVLGLGFNDSKGLLFVACSKLFGFTPWYKYGRIYMLSAKTGDVLDTIDQAYWNYFWTGGYNKRTNGTSPGNVSGYTSTYDVDVDEKGNIYSQSYYGWTVEKWKYDGTLPTITKIEKVENTIPIGFELEQNYPNPFNPSTTINFSIMEDGQTKLIIYNSLGEFVQEVINDFLTKGSYKISFNSNIKGKQISSGIYFYKLTSNKKSITKKMVLLK